MEWWGVCVRGAEDINGVVLLGILLRAYQQDQAICSFPCAKCHNGRCEMVSYLGR